MLLWLLLLSLLLLLQYYYDYDCKPFTAQDCSKMPATHSGYAKAYLRAPIDPLELSHLVKNLPMVKRQQTYAKETTKCHYSDYYFFVVVMCDKVTPSGSKAEGVKCLMEWGISDYHGKKVRLANTRYLYIEAQYDWHEEFTESWQKEVNQLMIAIKGLIEPLIMDPPPTDSARSAGKCR